MRNVATITIAFLAATASAFAPTPFGRGRLHVAYLAKGRPTLEEVRQTSPAIPAECKAFNEKVTMAGDEIKFEEVMEIIGNNYDFENTEFRNGNVVNKAGENGGTAKVLSYAALSGLDKDATLKLWGQHYRDVLNDPNGDSHQNIRNFMEFGWEGVSFEEGIALTPKKN